MSGYLIMNSGNINMSEESAILIEDKIFQSLRDEYEQLSYKELKLLKYKNDLVQLEEEDDVENFTDAYQADDNNFYEYGVEEDDDERDLTNLAWLTELRNQTCLVSMALDEESKKNNEPVKASIDQLSSQEITGEIPSKTKTHILGQQNLRTTTQVFHYKSDEPRTAKVLHQPRRPSPGERYEIFLNKIKRDLEIYEESAVNFQSDIVEKPPFNYSHIIGMAMLENGRRVTLQQICSWIERKFAFFRARKQWNNSIRHNLSLHPCFRKIGRNKEDRGKGGYWELAVDPKKCDRRRIRNRKSTAQPTNTQKKHMQAKFIKTSKRRQQYFANMKKINCKNCNKNVQNFNPEQDYEELMLDEMDVQQNIDVMSTSTNSRNNIISTAYSCYKHAERPHAELELIHESMRHHPKSHLAHKEGEEVMLTNFINENDNDDHIHLQENDGFKEINKCCSLTLEDICQGNENFSEQTGQQQHYKLGTIVINSENVVADMPNIENINQLTITSFLTNNSRKQLVAEQTLCTNSFL